MMETKAESMRPTWLWLVGGVSAIGVGLAIWETTFILVPAGLVLVGVGVTQLVRRHGRSAPD
jgi:hypothetical protein